MPTAPISLFVNRLPGRTRIAVTRKGALVRFEIVEDGERGSVGQVYIGKVTRVVPALNAAFLDLGDGLSGFLNRGDLPKTRFPDKRTSIEDVLKEGHLLTVRIKRAGYQEKLPRVQAFDSPGLALIALPNDPGIHFAKGYQGDLRRETAQNILPSGDTGWLLRSAASQLPEAHLIAEATYHLEIIAKVKSAFETGRPGLVHAPEIDLTLLFDHWREGIHHCYYDNEALHGERRSLFLQHFPAAAVKLIRHGEPYPLFDVYKIHTQLEEAKSSKVWLPSGGSIEITPTRALTAIDVDSGKNTRTTGGVSNAMRTNNEAVWEIARHVGLRNIAGLIAIDFIGASSKEYQALDSELGKAFANDRARVDILPINRFGIAQISRERKSPDLFSRTHEPCGDCGGTGFQLTIEAAATELWQRLARELTGLSEEVVEIFCGQRMYAYLEEKSYLITNFEQIYSVRISLRENKKAKPLDFTLRL